MNYFSSPVGPWVTKIEEKKEKEIKEKIIRLCKERRHKFFCLDGARMATLENFYDELIRVLKLPDYFGRNLNALDECLCDLSVLGVGPFILWINNGENVLRFSANKDGLIGFIDTLNFAGEEWSHPVEVGEAWDRDAQAFHAVFSFSSLSEVPAAIRQLPDLLDCCGSIQSAQMDD